MLRLAVTVSIESVSVNGGMTTCLLHFYRLQLPKHCNANDQCSLLVGMSRKGVPKLLMAVGTPCPHFIRKHRCVKTGNRK